MWKYLLEKEFKQFFRDQALPRILLVFPLMMMMVFPFAVSMEIRNINLVVVDNCGSQASANLISTCTESGYFRLVRLERDPERAQELMDRNEADALLTIEDDFDEKFGSGENLPLHIKVNTVNGTKGNIGAEYLSVCVRRYLSEAGGTGTAQSKLAAGIPTIDVSTRYYYTPYMDYKVFMVPAMIVIAVTMITGFFPALNIVGEKEKGTIEQINVSPVNRGVFMICKLIPYWLVAFFILTACLLLAYLVYGYTCAGSIASLYLFTILDIMVTAGLGLLISNYSDNAQQAMFITWFFMMVFMLVSGIFTPIASMPFWAKMLTYLNPMRYYADAMRAIYMKGSTFFDLWKDALGLLTIGSVMITWAILGYRKTN